MFTFLYNKSLLQANGLDPATNIQKVNPLLYEIFTELYYTFGPSPPSPCWFHPQND